MATHIIGMIPTRYSQGENVTPYDMDTWEATVEIMVENTYQSRSGGKIRHSLHFSGADNCHRTVQGGNVSQTPHGYLNPLPVVIALHPIAPEPVVTVNIGDLLVWPGHDVVLRVVGGGNRDNTGVQVVTCPPATVDHSAWAAEVNARPKRYVSESEMF